MLRFLAGVALGFYIFFWILIFAPLAIQAISGALLFESIEATLGRLMVFGFIVVTTLHIGTILLRLLLLRHNALVK